MSNVVEGAVLEVVQAWELTNSELKRQGRRHLGVSHPDYKHLKRIRNKLVAHRIENLAKTERHRRWYKRTYGSYASVLALVARVAQRVASKVSAMELAGLIRAKSVSVRVSEEFTNEEFQSLLRAV